MVPSVAASGLQGGGEPFEAARARAREAFGGLAAHWRPAGEAGSAGAQAVAQAAAWIAEDPGELTEEGHAWSREAGLAFLLPSGALQCRPLAQSVGAEGLQVSSLGGPVVPTHAGLLVAPAPPCGFGVFAAELIAKGARLGEYLGEARCYDVWVEEIMSRKRAQRGSDASVPFIREELYAAWTGTGPNGAGVVVDAYAAGNTMRFINCSCSPNTTFRSFGRGAQQHSRLEVVALRDIEPWEQLSVNYGWYFDDATLVDVRAQAVLAYAGDREDLERLAARLRARAAAGGTEAAAELVHDAGSSDALRVFAEAVDEARGLPRPPRATPTSFLRRFVNPEDVATFLERADLSGKVANCIADIPDALWPLYEVVGADAVGIPCRCGMDPSLNLTGHCSGIIGRPLQAVCDGRGDSLAADSEWLA